MASHAEKCGVVVKQGEDELAVVNMAVGAGVAGVRVHVRHLGRRVRPDDGSYRTRLP